MSASGGAEPDTDPGRPRPYESLYGSASTSWHYVQSTSAPDEADSGYDWLFRDGGVRSPPPAEDIPTVPRVMPPVVSTPVPRPPEPRPRPRNRGLSVALVLLVVFALAGAVTGTVLLLAQQRASRAGAGTNPAGTNPAGTNPAGTASSTGPASTPVSGEPTTSPASALIPTRATVACQAPSATDDAGQLVSYTPAQMFDGDPSTAWRCDGRGVGQQITFTLPAGSKIAALGLVNGYTKVDPTSGSQRYAEYRRITDVTWSFPGGAAYKQRLSDGVETVQSMPIPARSADQVTLTIDGTTEPGSTARTRDAVLISEIAVGAG